VSRPNHPQGLQLRVSSAILDAAASLVAAREGEASMAEIATAAGVARGTVYRYFPSRQALTDALTQVALDQVESRLIAARIDEVEPLEGLARAVRALVDAGDYATVLARERTASGSADFDRRVGRPIRRLFERAQGGKSIRGDVASSWLGDALLALVVSGLQATPRLGREDMVATVTSVFLDGARQSPGRA
jgi:TetR/AcrR family transcriptional regulator, mexCD-oprJ operon repressor